MINTAIEHLVEYPLSQSELNELSRDQQGVVAVLSYAVSETNALSRCYIACMHANTDKPEIEAALNIQRFTILRTWSAKLFEAHEFLQFGGKKRNTEDEEILKLADEVLSEFSALRSGAGFKLAKCIRHEATNHYSLSAAVKNLGHISPRANFNMYLHDLNGNSFYPIGEEVMFLGRLNRFGANLSEMEEKKKAIGDWLDWNLEANRWLGEAHLRYVRKFILDRNPKKYGRKKAYWIDPRLVGTKAEIKVPVFYRKGE